MDSLKILKMDVVNVLKMVAANVFKMVVSNVNVLKMGCIVMNQLNYFVISFLLFSSLLEIVCFFFIQVLSQVILLSSIEDLEFENIILMQFVFTSIITYS
eukprot:GHVR01169162.1.p1 GENE.GHVR01169162.1~~GHVR01169162.1.p1  ORF type:complete len:100 (+),score=3.21 GHVR01169162.1:139-438(+)